MTGGGLPAEGGVGAAPLGLKVGLKLVAAVAVAGRRQAARRTGSGVLTVFSLRKVGQGERGAAAGRGGRGTLASNTPAGL